MRKLILALALLATPAIARPTSHINTACVNGYHIVFIGPRVELRPC